MKNYSKTIACSLVVASTLSITSRVDAMEHDKDAVPGSSKVIERTAPTQYEELTLLEAKKMRLMATLLSPNCSHGLIDDVFKNCTNTMLEELTQFGLTTISTLASQHNRGYALRTFVRSLSNEAIISLQKTYRGPPNFYPFRAEVLSALEALINLRK